LKYESTSRNDGNVDTLLQHVASKLQATKMLQMGLMRSFIVIIVIVARLI